MWNDLRIRLRSLFRRSTVEAELDDELRFHREQQTRKYLAAGLSQAEATRRVQLEFGGLTQVKEECRNARGITFLQTVGQDLRYSARMLKQSPGFTAVVILTLCIGIGTSTAIFSVVEAVLLRSLPVENPSELVVPSWFALHGAKHLNGSSYGDCLELTSRNDGRTSGCNLSTEMFNQLRSRKDLFSATTAFAGPEQMNLTGNRQASIVRGELVSGEYFTTLGIHAALGRVLQPDDNKPGATPVAVLNYEQWRQQFGSDGGVLGRTIHLNGLVVTIIGVADPHFTRLTPGHVIDLWVPLVHVVALVPRWTNPNRTATSWWLTVVARLRSNVSRVQAQKIVGSLFVNQVVHGFPKMWTLADQPRLDLLPAQTGLAGIRNDLGEPLHLLTAAVSLLLLITCSNVAGLLVARGSVRGREFALRLAIGAARKRLLRQLLTESLLLSLLGALPGTVLAYSGATAWNTFFAVGASEPLPVDMGPTTSVLFIAVSVAVLTSVGFGFLPALQGSQTTPIMSLKAAGTTTVGRLFGRRKWSTANSLVALQVALTVLVLSAAGLLLRTLEHLRSVNPGFETKNMLLFALQPSLAGYKDHRITMLYHQLQERLSGLAGVQAVSYSSDAMLDNGLWTEGIKFPGRKEDHRIGTQMLLVGSSYFETMKIPLVAGTLARQADAATEGAVAIVNQEFAHQFLPGQNPLGVLFSNDDAGSLQRQIIGVVGNTKYADLRSVNKPTAYLPLRDTDATFVLRTSIPPASLSEVVRKVVNQLDPNLPVVRIRTQEDSIDRLLFHERLLARLFTLFGTIGSFLASVGLYGLLSFEVARRTREWGIRTALGAERKDTLRFILGRGLALVSIGVVIGVVAAAAANHLLGHLLYGVTPTDPLTLALVAASLVVVGTLACWLPARRAMKLDPIAALRYE